MDYIKKIQAAKTIGLLSILDKLVERQSIRGWPPGIAFEHVVLRAFDLESSARIIWPFEVRMNEQVIEQIDGAVYVENLSCLIETKDYNDPLNVEPIAKLKSQLARRPMGTMGIVFAMNDFSEPAKQLTRMMNPLNILLWNYEELRDAIENQTMCQALKTKYMFACERGMPDYDIRKGLR